jgi:twinkle protein
MKGKKNMQQISNPAHVNPLEARGLDPELAAKLGCYLVQTGFVFDFKSRGQVRYKKFRSWDKTKYVVKPSGIPKQLWLLHMIEDLPFRPKESLVMTEGEFDTIAAIQGWGGYSVSVPNGGNVSRTEPGKLIADDKMFSYLWTKNFKLIPELAQFDRIILATDNDEVGQVLREELAIRIGPSRCWHVTYPEGCKDLNDVLKRHGPEAVRFVLEQARPIRPGHLVKPGDVPPPRHSLPFSTGWDFMDPHLMLVRPELLVVTGIPGHGKGVFVRSMCYNLADKYGMRTAFWTPEDPAHRLRRDMKRFAMRKSSHPTPEEQSLADKWYDDHFMVSMLGEEERPTIPRIIEEMESAVLHHNCQSFVVDPWNCIVHQKGRSSDTEYIADSLEEFKFKMRELNLLLFIVAHPTKIKEGESVRLYSINGSANWHNKADHGIIIDRMFDSSKNPLDIVEATIEKCKDQETMGRPGRVCMKYIPEKSDYIPHAMPLKAA